MTRCQAVACNKSAGTFSRLCSTHKSRLRKQGHEEQSSITKTQLDPYLRRVRERRLKNPENPVWPILVARWQRLCDDSRGVINAYEQGQAMVTQKKLAAEEALRLTTTADLQDIIDTALAMFIMWEMVPRLFQSDRAFKTQLVRRVLRVSAANAQTYTGSDRPKRAYRDLPPKTVEVLSLGLIQAFGATGVKLGQLEKQEAEQREGERQELSRGLEGLE